MARKETAFDKPIIFEPSYIHNINQLTRFKDITSLAFGTCCGILQLKSFQGLIFFIITNFLSSLIFQASIIKFKHLDDYYKSPINDIYLNNLTRFIASFIMMWCLFYALVSF